MNLEEIEELVGKAKKYVIEVDEQPDDPPVYHVVFKHKNLGFVWDVRAFNKKDIDFFDYYLSKNSKYRTYEDLARDLVVAKEDLGAGLKIGEFWVVADPKVVVDGMVDFMLEGKNGWWDVKVSKTAPIGLLSRDLFIEYKLGQKRKRRRNAQVHVR